MYHACLPVPQQIVFGLYLSHRHTFHASRQETQRVPSGIIMHWLQSINHREYYLVCTQKIRSQENTSSGASTYVCTYAFLKSAAPRTTTTPSNSAGPRGLSISYLLAIYPVEVAGFPAPPKNALSSVSAAIYHHKQPPLDHVRVFWRRDVQNKKKSIQGTIRVFKIARCQILIG